MKRIYCSIALAYLSLYASTAFSESILTCEEKCSTSEMLRIATGSLRLSSHGTIVSVVEPKTLTARSYRVVFKRKFGEFLYDKVVKIPTTNHVLQKVKEIEEARREVKYYIVKIPSDLPGTNFDDNIESVHQIIMEPQLRKRISDYINEDMGLSERISHAVVIAGKVLGKLKDVHIFVQVELPDGSTAKFKLTDVKGLKSDFDFEFMLGSAVDNEDTLIPAEASDFVGTFHFDDVRNVDRLSDVIREFYNGGIELSRGRCNPNRTRMHCLFNTRLVCFVTLACP